MQGLFFVPRPGKQDSTAEKTAGVYKLLNLFFRVRFLLWRAWRPENQLNKRRSFKPERPFSDYAAAFQQIRIAGDFRQRFLRRDEAVLQHQACRTAFFGKFIMVRRDNFGHRE